MKIGLSTELWERTNKWQSKIVKIMFITMINIILLLLSNENIVVLIYTGITMFITLTMMLSYNKWNNNETKKRLRNERKQRIIRKQEEKDKSNDKESQEKL